MNLPATICVCGAGTMGSGIAQAFAAGGFHSILFDLDSEVILRAENNIRSNLNLLADKKKISPAQSNDIFSAIRFTSNIGDCRAGLVIEAIIENAAAKSALFNQLAGLNPTGTIFVTNTSSLSVTALAQNFAYPERFAGMHFFNPAPIMKLVELVRTAYTSPDIIDLLSALVKQLGKTAVVCNDAPGFIVNRVARPYYIESLRLAELGVSFETIDKLMESTGFKMGPFRLMDLIGNDINYSVSCIVYEALGKPPRLQPSLIQQQKVEQGSLGRKTGKGYYEYPGKFS